MAALEPLSRLIHIKSYPFTKEERILLEAELFLQICKELKNVFGIKHKDYFRFLKLSPEMENSMLEKNFARLVINDILSTDEYTLEGVAYYTDTHEDVIYELVTGQNTSPSAMVLQKIIELHRSVRCELYESIIKKITAEYAKMPCG